MSPAEVAGLVAAGTLAGLVSTVASVASLVSYPVLLAIGLTPLAANVTNTVSLLFTGVGAAAGSRPELTGQRARLLRLGPVCLLGGAAGAAVLLLTPASWFGYAAPVLIAAGSVILLIPRPAARASELAGDPAAADRADQNPPTQHPASRDTASPNPTPHHTPGQDTATLNPTPHPHSAGQAAASGDSASQETDAHTQTPHQHSAGGAAARGDSASQAAASGDSASQETDAHTQTPHQHSASWAAARGDPAGQAASGPNPALHHTPGQDTATPSPTPHQHPAGQAGEGLDDPVGRGAAQPEPAQPGDVDDPATAGQDAAVPNLIPHQHPAGQALAGQTAASQDAAGQEPTPGRRVRAAVAAHRAAAGRDRAGQEPVPGWWVCAAVAGVACYIGYFGAAGGILMLALLAATQASGRPGPLARANAAKNVLNGLANAAAAVAFACFGPVNWAVVPPLAAGFLAGGAAGPAVVRRLPARVLRIGVAAAGLAIAIKLGAAAYSHAAAPSH